MVLTEVRRCRGAGKRDSPSTQVLGGNFQKLSMGTGHGGGSRDGSNSDGENLTHLGSLFLLATQFPPLYFTGQSLSSEKCYKPSELKSTEVLPMTY